MPHVDDDLLAAWVIDGSDDLLDDAAHAHVVSCDRCTARVEELRSVDVALGAGPLVAPPASLRAKVLAQVAEERVEAPAPAAPAEVPAPVVPSADVVDLASRRRGVPLWAAGVAAAVTLVAGVGVGSLLNRTDDTTVTREEVVASAELTTVEGTDPRGAAQVVRVDDADGSYVVKVDASSLDDAAIHEVWLLNLDGERMVSLGLLTKASATFEVPAQLLEDGYVVLDISDEPADGDPTHSGVSIARGELT